MTSYAGFLAYRLKMQPEDFLVKELSDISLVDRSPFLLYELEKESWNTADALLRISKENGLPLKKFNYGGKKDRHARTLQYFTVEDSRTLKCNLSGCILRKLGYADGPMTPERILGNRFSITVRNVLERELPAIQTGRKRLQRIGFPNYFDDQRFGSFHPVVGFSFLCLYRGDPEAALKYTLLSPFGGEKSHAKKRKKAIHDSWGNWDRCLELAQTKPEKHILTALREAQAVPRPLREPSMQERQTFLSLLERLPREELSMGFASLQSWIFNESLARMIRCLQARKDMECVEIKTKTGDQCFPVRMEGTQSMLNTARCMLVGTGGKSVDPSHNPAEPGTQSGEVARVDAEYRAALGQVLNILEIPESRFQDSLLRSAFMKGYSRPLWCMPENLRLDEPENDELNTGKLKYTIHFELPRGSYATMALKALHLRLKSTQF